MDSSGRRPGRRMVHLSGVGSGAPVVLALWLVVAQGRRFSRHHSHSSPACLADPLRAAAELCRCIAYDASKSMEIRDGPEGQSRLDVERHLLRSADNPWLDELGKKFKLRFFRFSHSAERVQAFEDTARHGQVTDLERTLDQISGELANVPAAGIVLITDGADNRSSDLDRTASRLRARNTPIYTVGIGSTSFLHDTEITESRLRGKYLGIRSWRRRSRCGQTGMRAGAPASLCWTGTACCRTRRSHWGAMEK